MRVFNIFMILFLILGIFAAAPLVQAAVGPCDAKDEKWKCGLWPSAKWNLTSGWDDFGTRAGFDCIGEKKGNWTYSGYLVKTCTKDSDCDAWKTKVGCADYTRYMDDCGDKCLKAKNQVEGYKCVDHKCLYAPESQFPFTQCSQPDEGWKKYCCYYDTAKQVTNPDIHLWWAVNLNPNIRGPLDVTVREACCYDNQVPANPYGDPYNWGRKDCATDDRGKIINPNLPCTFVQVAGCTAPKVITGTFNIKCSSSCEQDYDKTKCLCSEQACGENVDNCPLTYNPKQTNSDGDGEGNICDICPWDPTNTCNPLAFASAVIGSAGGTISTGDGVATLNVPAGALGESEITLGAGENSGEVIVASDGVILTDYYIIPSGLNFTTPATLTLKYEQGNMAECGKQEQAIGMYYVDPVTWNWIAAHGVFDCVNNTVTVQLTNFTLDDYNDYSEYALIAPLDTDNDGVFNNWGAEVDNCPNVTNPDQADMDNDGIGDVCDSDVDGDGVINSVDFCPTLWTINQGDIDRDGLGDECDPDMDNDGILNAVDNCPFSYNPSQTDSDGDGVGDACDNCWHVSNPEQNDTNNSCELLIGDPAYFDTTNPIWIKDPHCGDACACIASAEICNGVDDDCDGQIDEGYVPTPTSCGEGACAATGQLVCLNGAEVNTCEPGVPTSDENCNGIDDDCDGMTDEHYVEVQTNCGVDLCSNTGTLTCVNGRTQDTCVQLPPVTVYHDGDSDNYGSAANTQSVCTIPAGYILTDDDCNDADNTINPAAPDVCDINHQVINKNCNPGDDYLLDCNDYCGDADGDGYVTAEKWGEWGGIIPSIICPWIVGKGDCNDGNAAIHPGADDSVCNGVDDNCNGVVDDGYVPHATSCGVGACAAQGQLVCQAGTLVDTCTPGTPIPETCNGIDDNCNGAVDDLDADNDGLNDCNGADKCLGSLSDNIALNPNQYAQNNLLTSAFESGPGNDQSIVYNMQNTKGCTCRQITAALGLGIGQIKKGCAPGVMQQWTGLAEQPDRVAGIGKK